MKPINGFRALLCSVLTFLSLSIVTAQTTHPKPVTPLRIGDTVPDMVLTTLGGTHHRLSEYKGQAVILNLMSIYCATCLANMPRLNGIEHDMADSLHIFYAVPESTPTINEYMSRRAKMKALTPRFVNTSRLDEYFPHRFVPHVVWLNGDRKVVAITDDREVTAASMRRLYKGESLHVWEKRDDMDFSMETPVLNDRPPLKTTVYYRSAFSGTIEDEDGGAGLFSDSVKRRLIMLNMPMDQLYGEALGGLEMNRLIFELRDTTRYLSNDTHNWDTGHNYTYELTVPVSVDIDELRGYARKDLDRYFNVSSGYEEREMPVYCIQRKRDAASPAKSIYIKPDLELSPNDTIELWHYTVNGLVQALNSSSLTGAPIFSDETAYAEPVDMRLDVPGTRDLEAFRLSLEKYGFTLVRKMVRMQVYVVRERVQNDTSAQNR